MPEIPSEADVRPEVGRQDDWGVLMARAQGGDQEAYRQLLLDITPFLRAIVRRSLRERADAEDALQDILMTVHTVRHTYDPTRPFRPWLAGIARYRLLDRLRGAGRRAAREIALGPEHETFSSDTSNSDDVMTDQPTLRRALETLPASERQAIELTKLRELSLKEASTMSGMSVGALKVATHRGMLRLRRLLGG